VSGPRWMRYGKGTIILHLISGQSIRVRVKSFKHRYVDGQGHEFEWVPERPNTLPGRPHPSRVAAIEHHPEP
jgi:hypothetical protein